MVDAVNPAGLWQPFGPFSQAVFQGGGLGDVMSLTHYVTDMGWFLECGDIRREFFAPPYSVTTTAEVAALYHAELMIEIAAVAEIQRDRFKRPATLS